MNWSISRTLILVWLVCLAVPAVAQDATDGESADGGTADAPAESTTGSEEPASPLAELSESERAELEEEIEQRTAVFEQKRSELAAAIADQRETHTRYVNGEDDSQEARDRFMTQRDRVRELLDETYDAALDLSRWTMNKEAATFLVTMIEHRFAHDIYDESTVEGCARLIDGGSQLKYLFQAGARSAIVTGRFDLARQLYEAMTMEHMDDVDKTLLANIDDYEKQFKAEQEVREKEIAEDRLPRVKFKTTQGDVVIELFLDQAPSAVSHFIGLVENGFYDGLDFFQVLDHMLALTGDPSGVGGGNSGKFLLDEHEREDARKAFRGSVVMAKIPLGDSGDFMPHSASSQIAILYVPIVAISKQQTVIGRVVEGMNAMSRLRRVDPNKEKKKGQIELPPDSIIEATVVRRPDRLPEPKYLDLDQP